MGYNKRTTVIANLACCPSLCASRQQARCSGSPGHLTCISNIDKAAEEVEPEGRAKAGSERGDQPPCKKH